MLLEYCTEMWDAAMGWYGETRNAYNIFVEKPVINHPVGRPGWRWNGNIQMNLS
jgi:hypothetical protein